MALLPPCISQPYLHTAHQDKKKKEPALCNGGHREPQDFTQVLSITAMYYQAVGQKNVTGPL